MGQCEDDIEIPFPVVHSILIRRECISHRLSWGGVQGEKLVSLAGQKWELGRTKMGAWQDRNGSLAGQKWQLGRTEVGAWQDRNESLAEDNL